MSGITSRATNGTVTKSVARTSPGTAKRILHVVPGEPSAEPPLRPEEQDVDQARDDGRHRERQVDQRDEHGLAGKVELRHRPGRREAEHQVERHGDGGGQEREADGRPRIGLDDRAEVGAEPLPERLDEDRHHGQADEQDQKGEGDADQDPRGSRAARSWSARRAPRFSAIWLTGSCLLMPPAPPLERVDAEEQDERGGEHHDGDAPWPPRSRTARAW